MPRISPAELRATSGGESDRGDGARSLQAGRGADQNGGELRHREGGAESRRPGGSPQEQQRGQERPVDPVPDEVLDPTQDRLTSSPVSGPSVARRLVRHPPRTIIESIVDS